ncbi:protein DpdG [Rheinheimera sp. UJ63]|uniref:protein DpdG n=1 Tax=Rheinheimera sp. UJ63 TaxID=2910157 RepID=UPI001F3CCB58|nr:protein DpdG [Rheinheimera sp. UJ63]MCF4010635.1 hypothetical protein [Rheinheimera sp. UJ63]
MSVINNANPGSHIASLHFIDRLVNRHFSKKNKSEEHLPLTAILSSNMPDYLFIDEECDSQGEFKRSTNPEKKLRETLFFWKETGLWQQNEEGIKAWSEFSCDDNLGERITQTLFKEKLDIVDGTGIEPLLRGMALFLCLDSFTFAGGNFFKPTEIEAIVGKYLPPRSGNDTRLTINSSETATFANYGLLLGFLEQVTKDTLVVDPTRLIRPAVIKILKNSGAASEMPVEEFLIQLSGILPVIDGGAYRCTIEELIRSKVKDWKSLPEHELSASLSQALYRLNIEGVIFLVPKSDAEKTMQLNLPGNKKRPVSHIRFGVEK